MEIKVDAVVPFADDEHTASDGPYVRVLKARKWLYITSGLATLHHYRLLHYPATLKLTGGLVELADWIMTNAFRAAVVIVWIQFLLLLVQLGLSYRTLITTRLLKNSAETVAREREAIDAILLAKPAAEQAFATLGAEEDAIRSQLDTNRQLVEIAQKAAEDRAARGPAETLTEKALAQLESYTKPEDLERKGRELAHHLTAIERKRSEALDTIEAIERRWRDASGALERRLNQSPERNPLYWIAEIGIDLMRVGAPLAVGSIALYVAFLLPR